MTDLTYDQQLHLTLLDHTVAIVKTWAPLDKDNIGPTVSAVYAALRDVGTPLVSAPEIDKPTARQIADAVQADSILCFEDGKRYKSLKRTVAKYGLTPAEYRTKWGLPPDFPMVAPSYSVRRSELAKANGLGKTR